MQNISTLSERILEITGHTSDINEALDEFENVKEAVGELFDTNQALAILNRRMRLTLDFASQAIDIVERDAAMFITPKARAWIEKFREQREKLDHTIAQSKEIIEKEHSHANPTHQPND
jgi:regulator of replication initiation timing